MAYEKFEFENQIKSVFVDVLNGFRTTEIKRIKVIRIYCLNCQWEN